MQAIHFMFLIILLPAIKADSCCHQLEATDQKGEEQIFALNGERNGKPTYTTKYCGNVYTLGFDLSGHWSVRSTDGTLIATTKGNQYKCPEEINETEITMVCA